MLKEFYIKFVLQLRDKHIQVQCIKKTLHGYISLNITKSTGAHVFVFLYGLDEKKAKAIKQPHEPLWDNDMPEGLPPCMRHALLFT